jgi:hypothetical protein
MPMLPIALAICFLLAMALKASQENRTKKVCAELAQILGGFLAVAILASAFVNSGSVEGSRSYAAFRTGELVPAEMEDRPYVVGVTYVQRS